MSFFDSFNEYRKYQNNLRYKLRWLYLVLLILVIAMFVGIYYWQKKQKDSDFVRRFYEIEGRSVITPK